MVIYGLACNLLTISVTHAASDPISRLKPSWTGSLEHQESVYTMGSRTDLSSLPLSMTEQERTSTANGDLFENHKVQKKHECQGENHLRVCEDRRAACERFWYTTASKTFTPVFVRKREVYPIPCKCPLMRGASFSIVCPQTLSQHDGVGGRRVWFDTGPSPSPEACWQHSWILAPLTILQNQGLCGSSCYRDLNLNGCAQLGTCEVNQESSGRYHQWAGPWGPPAATTRTIRSFLCQLTQMWPVTPFKKTRA